MMEFTERLEAEAVRDKLRMILPELKAAYHNMEYLEANYNWDVKSPEMCEAYMTLADVCFGVMESLDGVESLEKKEGGEK